ncbi:hypothetical protein LTR17_000445 [Elasticomyces elasticus]|nr:hypothetical protein LTR17_000445 [Elasticomyces elasticus]
MSSHSAPLLSSSAADLDLSSPSPSLYVTFRVLAVVNALQKRFARRGNARPTKRLRLRVTKAKARRPPSQHLETQAYAEIDKYLGRKTIYPSERRSRKGQRLSDSISVVDNKEQIHGLLSKLDSQVNNHALSSIADQDTLFLGRRAHFHIKKVTLDALIDLLLDVKDLIRLIQRSDTNLDDTYVANLEHLLLCLHHQVLGSLITRCIALVRAKHCPKNRQRRSWFFEFPNNKHPNTSTGPFALPPSLAVLWGGDCWKFPDRLDGQGNIVDGRGQIKVPFSVVELYSRQIRQQQQQQQPRPSYPPGAVQTADPMAQPRSWHPTAQVAQAATLSSRQPGHREQPHINFDQRAPDHATQSLAQSTSGAAPPDPRQHIYWHGSNLGLGSESSAYLESSLWQPSSIANSQPPFLPLRVTPQPRLDLYGEDYSGSSASSAREDFSYGAYVPYPQLSQNQMAQVQAPQASMHHTPEQPYSPNTDPALVALNGLKRSHSQMSHNDTQVQYEIPIPYPPPPPHMLQQEERAGSVVSNHDEQSDDSPHHGSRSFKRGNPPQNANLKYYCDFSSECDGMTFDRKCEWSKHMDKHDRPYRCPHSQCGKLQGFTYSGGLLRHEREVHGKHGGPKAALSCPYEDCKRHTGKGFTRKENLNEHIRRVHNDKTPAPLQEQDIEAAEAAAAAFKAGLQEAIAGATQRPMPAKLPYPEPAPEQQYIPEPAEMVKRRRVEEEPVPTEPEDTPQNEIERLLVENAQQAARIREMETQEARRELRISQLEDMLTQVHSPQQTTHITIDDKILAVAQQT